MKMTVLEAGWENKRVMYCGLRDPISPFSQVWGPITAMPFITASLMPQSLFQEINHPGVRGKQKSRNSGYKGMFPQHGGDREISWVWLGYLSFGSGSSGILLPFRMSRFDLPKNQSFRSVRILVFCLCGYSSILFATVLHVGKKSFILVGGSCTASALPRYWFYSDSL